MYILIYILFVFVVVFLFCFFSFFSFSSLSIYIIYIYMYIYIYILLLVYPPHNSGKIANNWSNHGRTPFPRPFNSRSFFLSPYNLSKHVLTRAAKGGDGPVPSRLACLVGLGSSVSLPLFLSVWLSVIGAVFPQVYLEYLTCWSFPEVF